MSVAAGAPPPAVPPRKGATFTTEFVEPRRKGTTLAVVVHGWSASGAKMEQVARMVWRERIDADVLVVDHSGGRWYANIRPELVAARVARAIEAKLAEHPYERILLIGHSAGGLLVRKAYVFAGGKIDDSPSPGDELTWKDRVERIVTFAALDRGFTLGANEVAAGDSFGKALLRTVLYRVSSALHFGGFIHALERGSPFVVNTRVQWIRLAQEQGSVPLFQLVGDNDDLVGERDNIDTLLNSDSYRYLTVTDATHTNIVDVDENPEAARLFRHALTFQLPAGAKPTGEQPGVTGVVYVMHGIRDQGVKWAEKLGKQVEEIAGGSIAAVHRSYGYFSALEFIFLTRRMRNVRWFMDRYTEQIARHPGATHDYVGHSNGTYVIGNAFQNYATCRMRRVVLAGCVLPTDYEWDARRVEAVRNEVGSADIVVALLPRLWERLGDLLRFFGFPVPAFVDLGGAGVLGFDDVDVVINNRYVQPYWDDPKRKPTLRWLLFSGHGAALTGPDTKSIATFIATGNDEQDPETHTDVQLSAVEKTAQFGWLAALGAVLVIGGIGALVTHLLGPAIYAAASAHPVIFALVVGGVALVLVLLLLTA